MSILFLIAASGFSFLNPTTTRSPNAIAFRQIDRIESASIAEPKGEFKVHKLRIESFKPSTCINNNDCSNPLLPFQISSSRWKIVGLEFAGTLTTLLSAFAAIGAVLGARTLVKEIFEWITQTWKSSPKKQIALFSSAILFKLFLL